MKASRIDWARLISEEAKVSPLLKSDEIARRLGMSELVVRRSLLRLVKRGMIEHFAKKWFINLLARDFLGRELVNLLRPQAYVSLQTVLREAGISSQTPVSITGVTTGEAASFSSRTVSIVFRHIKPGLYWGFQARRTLYGTYNVAEPEKALLDWFYLERKRGAEAITDEYDFSKLDREKLLLYAQKYPRPVKHELLESLARPDAALSKGSRPLRTRVEAD
jgi:DNA-binding Lrp family transcriptional regulator